MGNTNTHLTETVKKTAAGSTLTASGTTQKVKSTATYSADGNYLTSVTDSLGGTTEYAYYTNGLLKYVQNANQKRIGAFYEDNRIATVWLDKDQDGALDSGEAAVYYWYLQNRLSKIQTATG